MTKPSPASRDCHFPLNLSLNRCHGCLTSFLKFAGDPQIHVCLLWILISEIRAKKTPHFGVFGWTIGPVPRAAFHALVGRRDYLVMQMIREQALERFKSDRWRRLANGLIFEARTDSAVGIGINKSPSIDHTSEFLRSFLGWLPHFTARGAQGWVCTIIL